MSIDLAEALRLLPKVELHCHIEGTMRPGTVVELAHKNGILLPDPSPENLYNYGNLNEFLEVFFLVQSTLSDRGDWAQLAYESVVDAALSGRVYAESFFTPASAMARGQRLGEILAGLDEGLDAGDSETGARTMLICDMDRAHGGAAGFALVENLVELMVARAPGTERIVGIGMDSTELGVDPLDFGPAYALAAKSGLRRTAHQGEDTPPSAIATCVDVLGAERIDHGLSLGGDPALLARFAADRIPITVCPTSNVVIANRVPELAAHPFPAWRAAGLLLSLNTDDPALTDLDLGREYVACASAFSYGFDEMVQVALDGVESSWLDESDGRALRSRIQASAMALRARMGSDQARTALS
jgi:adenosine deaminase